jgi:putative inorganic carbon (hco3(-)) transporter
LRPCAHREPLDQAILVVGYLFVAFSIISIAGTHISLGLLAALWIYKALCERKWPLQRTELDYALLGLILAFVLSTIFSLQPLASFRNLKNPLLMIVIYLAAATFTRQITIRRAMDIFIFTAAIVAAIGIFSTQILAGKKVMGLQSTTMTWGAMSVIFAVLTFAQLLFGPTGRKKWWYAAALLVQGVAMLFSYVRGAWLGFISALVFLIVLKNKKMVFLLLLLVLVVFAAAPQPLQYRIRNITNLNVGSTQVRLTQWHNAVKIFKDHPWTGVGWIDLANIHKQYAPKGADLNYEAYWIGHFHSNYVMFLVCFGVIGVVSLIYFLYTLFRVLWRISRAIPKSLPAEKAWAYGTLAASLGFWINGFFDWTFGDAEPVTLWWLTLGITFAIHHSLYSQQQEVS